MKFLETASSLQTFWEDDLGSFLSSAIKKRIKSAEKREKFSIVTTDIENLLKNTFESVECHLLGSRLNCTSIKVKVPVDISLLLGKESRHSQDMLTIKNLMESSDDWKNVRECRRVGLYSVLAKHKITQVECNFMLATRYIIKNNELVSCFFELQPMCKFCFIKCGYSFY